MLSMMKIEFSSSESKDEEVNCSLLISRDQGPPHKLWVMMDCHDASPSDCYLRQQPTYGRACMHNASSLANVAGVSLPFFHLDAIAK
jgi:hypothetical protein